MKSTVILIFAILASAAILLAPHHRRGPDSFRPNTLCGIYRDLVAQMPTRWNAERVTFLLILIAGICASAAPVVVAGLLRWHRPAAGAAGGAGFAVLGVLCVIGAAANGLMIAVNQMNFAFGGGRGLPGDAVAFAWAVAIAQLLAGIASVAIAGSARCATIAS